MNELRHRLEYSEDSRKTSVVQAQKHCIINHIYVSMDFIIQAHVASDWEKIQFQIRLVSKK